jgi:hypothetical protein
MKNTWLGNKMIIKLIIHESKINKLRNDLEHLLLNIDYISFNKVMDNLGLDSTITDYNIFLDDSVINQFTKIKSEKLYLWKI